MADELMSMPECTRSLELQPVIKLMVGVLFLEKGHVLLFIYFVISLDHSSL